MYSPFKLRLESYWHQDFLFPSFLILSVHILIILEDNFKFKNLRADCLVQTFNLLRKMVPKKMYYFLRTI